MGFSCEAVLPAKFYTKGRQRSTIRIHSNDNVTAGTMPTVEKMSLNERRKYLRLIKKRHLKVSKLERGRLLDDVEVTTGSHRRRLIRLVSGSPERRRRHVERL